MFQTTNQWCFYVGICAFSEPSARVLPADAMPRRRIAIAAACTSPCPAATVGPKTSDVPRPKAWNSMDLYGYLT